MVGCEHDQDREQESLMEYEVTLHISFIAFWFFAILAISTAETKDRASFLRGIAYLGVFFCLPSFFDSSVTLRSLTEGYIVAGLAFLFSGSVKQFRLNLALDWWYKVMLLGLLSVVVSIMMVVL
jgi:hypothetical protein